MKSSKKKQTGPPYVRVAKNGWKILMIGDDGYGRRYVLCDTNGEVPERYVVGKYYDVDRGIWAGGTYIRDYDMAVDRFRMYVRYIIDPDGYERAIGDYGYLFWTSDRKEIAGMGEDPQGNIVILFDYFDPTINDFRNVVGYGYDVRTGHYQIAETFGKYSDARRSFEDHIVREIDRMDVPYQRSKSRK